MDNTKEYILQCERSEIQNNWKPENGDLVYHHNEGEEIYGACEFPAEFEIVILSKIHRTEDWWRNWIWLPRQDQ